MRAADRLRLAFCGLHPDRARMLLAEWGSARAVVRALERGQVRCSAAVRASLEVSVEQRRSDLAALGVAPLLREELPPHLAELPDAPDLLFVRGSLPSEPGVAVVGTRRCTRYGRELARAFGYAVAAAGWPLVSGLARGIDGEAHRGTVEGDGVGVAVLGSGPDVWYPAEHRRLGEDLVVGGGAVVTEYPPGTPPEGWRFPPRNRIIAGLSKAVVVVEAGEKGGALITAGNAAEQGRTVFAVPGDVDRKASVGCNLLIRDGAHPVLGPDDLVEALSFLLGPPAAGRGGAAPTDPLLDLLGPTGRSVDDLVEATGRPLPDVLADVARLEASGRIARRGGVLVAAR